jgi:hypothetical protein
MGHQEGIGEAHIKVEIQSNSEFQSLTCSPTQSSGPPQLQIDVQDPYKIGFICSTYARKEDEIILPTTLVPGPNNFGFDPKTISISRAQLIREMSTLKLTRRSHTIANFGVVGLLKKVKR